MKLPKSISYKSDINILSVNVNIIQQDQKMICFLPVKQSECIVAVNKMSLLGK